MGDRAIRVTNVFTGKTHLYDGIEEFQEGSKSAMGTDVTGIASLLADAYCNGRSIETYEWLLGIKVCADE